jgi:hypothetical protein
MQTPGPTGQPAFIYGIAYIGQRTFHHATLIMSTLTGKDTVAMNDDDDGVKNCWEPQTLSHAKFPSFSSGADTGVDGSTENNLD